MVRRADHPVAIVTGATGGIGRWIARGLALEGYHVVMTGRDQTRGKAAQIWVDGQVPKASTELVVVDLSVLSATRNAAEYIASHHPEIAVLVNNAGVFDASRVLTVEGYERVLATNLLSPFVFTRTLLPALLAGAPSRVINIGSSTSDHSQINPEKLQLGENWTMKRAYAQSKLALMMVTFALARRLDGSGVVANVVHPGLVASGLVRTGGIIGFAWRCLAGIAMTEEQGAYAPLYAALDPKLATISGAYIKSRGIVQPNPQALDEAELLGVWAAVEDLVAQSDRFSRA